MATQSLVAMRMLSDSASLMLGLLGHAVIPRIVILWHEVGGDSVFPYECDDGFPPRYGRYQKGWGRLRKECGFP